MSFWNLATTAQKLAQIDAGIELGMTSAQVAMNCGCYADAHRDHGFRVRVFAQAHGRRFPAGMSTYGRQRLAEAARFIQMRARQDRTGFLPDAAHDIFEVQL